MRGRFWMSLVLATAVAAAGSWQWASAQPAGTAAPDASAAVIEQAVVELTDRDLPETSDRREAAARQLVAIRSEASRGQVRRILQSIQIPASQVAVARALVNRPDPRPEFIDPLFAMLGSNQPKLGLAAADALGTYKDDQVVLMRLIDIATGGGPVRGVLPRVAAIRGLGGMVDRAAAETLMRLLTAANELPEIKNAAADALGTLSGESRIGNDLQGWQRWWTEQSRKSAEQFRNELLIARANEFEPTRRSLESLRATFATVLEQEYQRTPEAARPEKVQFYLAHFEPLVRKVGAELVAQDFLDGRNPTEPVLTKLRDMISDPHAGVREEVAFTLATLNDALAFDAMFQQLAREDDPSVQAALTTALGRMRDLRAVDLFISLLDRRDIVAKAAADALQGLGADLREKDPARAHELALKLRGVYERSNAPTAQALRESVVLAMAELKDEVLREIFKDVLDEQSANFRMAGVRGIGNLGDPATAGLIGPMLKDDDPRVRLAAIEALLKVGGTEYARTLVEMIAPGSNEPPNIKQKAWDVLSLFLPELENHILQDFAHKLSEDLPKRIAILKQAAKKELDARRMSEYAATQLNIGEAQMKQGDFDEAVAAFDAVLTAGIPAFAERAVPLKMTALLRTGETRETDYQDAMLFATQVMRAEPAQSQEMGNCIKREADRIVEEGERNPVKLDNAIKLIARARQLQPSLPQNHLDLLAEIEKKVRDMQETNRGNGAMPITDINNSAPVASTPR